MTTGEGLYWLGPALGAAALSVFQDYGAAAVLAAISAALFCIFRREAADTTPAGRSAWVDNTKAQTRRINAEAKTLEERR